MIDLGKARELVKQAVEQKGEDFVYNPEPAGLGYDGWVGACYYEPRPDMFADDDPRATAGCLVGEALKLGGETRYLGFEGAVELLVEEYADMLSPDAAGYLKVAQIAQDKGSTWGLARETAERWCDNLEGADYREPKSVAPDAYTQTAVYLGERRG